MIESYLTDNPHRPILFVSAKKVHAGDLAVPEVRQRDRTFPLLRPQQVLLHCPRRWRKRRREELFAAEKRMKQLKHKPMHVRMKEEYRGSIYEGKIAVLKNESLTTAAERAASPLRMRNHCGITHTVF